MEKQVQVVGYVRVSTQRQSVSGLGREAQIKVLRDACAAERAELLEVFEEVESGRKNARPQLALAIAKAKRLGAVLMVAKLDRLSRDAAFLLALKASDLEIRACDLPGADKLVFTIMAGVAEWEARRISQRTREAIAARKVRNAEAILRGETPKRIGATLADLARGRANAAANRRSRASESAERLRPVVEYLMREHPGSSASVVAQLLEERRAAAPQGGTRWSHAQASRLLARLKIAA